MDDATARALALLSTLSREHLLGYPIDAEATEHVEVEDALDTWFEESEVSWRTLGHRFEQIARDGTGSLFCLWYYPELRGAPPVVFIGSEGDLALVANDAADFVRQLTMAVAFVGNGWAEPTTKDRHELDFDALRARVQAELGAWTESPAELRARAIERHPDLESWVEATAG